MEKELVKLGNVYGDYDGFNYGGNVYDPKGLSPCMRSSSSGQQNYVIVRKRKGQYEERCSIKENY